MTDQPTPRAPEHGVAWIEPGASAFVTFTCYCGAVCTDSGTTTIAAMLGRHIREAPAPEPSAPDDLQDKIAEALHRTWCQADYDCLSEKQPYPNDYRNAAAVMDVLRREGLTP